MTLDVSIIIINWNTRDLLAACLTSIYDTALGLTFDVWVVDNGSTDGSVEMVRDAFPEVHLGVNSQNEGFARANNQGMALSQGRYMLLFNSDAIASPGSLTALVALADAHPSAGIVGAKLVNADGSFQASYTDFPSLHSEFLMLTGLGRLLFGPWYPSHNQAQGQSPRPVDYVEGACLLVRRAAWEQVGGMDQDYFMYAEEVDWCYRMRHAGWHVYYAPVPIPHLGGGSSRHRPMQREADLYRSRVRFFRQHYGPIRTSVLKGMIYGLTTVKQVIHGMLRWVSGGSRGRRVPSLAQLHAAIADV